MAHKGDGLGRAGTLEQGFEALQSWVLGETRRLVDRPRAERLEQGGRLCGSEQRAVPDGVEEDPRVAEPCDEVTK